MKTRILIFFTLLCQLGLSQYPFLIDNGNFEMGNDASLTNYSTLHRDYFNGNLVQYWKSDYSNRKKDKQYFGNASWWPIFTEDCENSCDICGTCAYHSPDWFNDQNIVAYNVKNAAGDYISLGGNHCAGIGEYELLQQNMNTYLVNGNYYLIKLKILIPSLVGNFDLHPDRDLLNIMLANKEIDYKAGWKGFEYGILSYCPSDYTEYEDGLFQSIQTIWSIDLANYPKDQWIDLSYLYEVTDDEITSSNWFAIDIRNKYGMDCLNMNGYILLDDVVLKKVDYCNTDPCSPTDGLITNVILYPPFGDDHTTRCIEGLDNVKEIRNLKLYTSVNQQDPIYIYDDVTSINGITNPVCINLPEYLSSAPYILKVDLINDCGTEKRSWTMPDLTNLVYSTLPVYPLYNNSIQNPLPCCSTQPVININNEVITGSGNIELIAQEAIYANNVTITDDVDYVHFQAGNNIELTNFTSGDNFVAEIVSCSPHSNYRLAHNPVDNNNTPDNFISADVKQINNPVDYSEKTSTDNEINQNNSLQGINSTSRLDEPVFIVQPNPNKGKFMISFNGFPSTNFNVQIRDVLGKTVYSNTMNQNSSTIDLTSSPAGIYFISVCAGNECWTGKILKE